MPAKKVESFRQKECGTKVVRILHTSPFIDDKWVSDRSKMKKYLVVRYQKSGDGLLPTRDVYGGKRVQWWEPAKHAFIKKSVKNYDDNASRGEKDATKIKEAGRLFKKVSKEEFHTDDWDEAQTKYITWCAEDGITVKKIEVGYAGGDD